jgi:hypothetical protein
MHFIKNIERNKKVQLIATQDEESYRHGCCWLGESYGTSIKMEKR